tara:strand:+ start:1119 stop:1445 length:327 start_codon:yes stop_codon:yes gene_type:complete
MTKIKYYVRLPALRKARGPTSLHAQRRYCNIKFGDRNIARVHQRTNRVGNLAARKYRVQAFGHVLLQSVFLWIRVSGHYEIGRVDFEHALCRKEYDTRTRTRLALALR